MRGIFIHNSPASHYLLPLTGEFSPINAKNTRSFGKLSFLNKHLPKERMFSCSSYQVPRLLSSNFFQKTEPSFCGFFNINPLIPTILVPPKSLSFGDKLLDARSYRIPDLPELVHDFLFRSCRFGRIIKPPMPFHHVGIGNGRTMFVGMPA